MIRLGKGGCKTTPLLLLFICLLGFGLRVYQLEGQSLWNDEGLSVYRAKQSTAVILANTITIDGVDTTDTNPPLYFLALHFWSFLSGNGVFGLRFLGVLFGLLNIPLIYHLGRYLHSTAVGLVAAFLLAISPFHIWQTQEMRNYTLLLLFNLLSIYALFRFVFDNNRRWGWLILWGVSAVAGLYTHYFGAFVLAFGLLVVGWQILRGQDWRRYLQPRIVGLIAVLVLLSLPIFWMGLSRFQAGKQIDFTFVPIHHLLSHAASAYGVGIIHSFVQPLLKTAPAVVLAVVGLGVSSWRGRRITPILLMGYFLVPIVLLVILSAVNPLYNGPRHLLMGLPPFLLLAAGGIVALPGRWRLSTAVFALLIVFIQADWLENQFNAPELVKDDIRGLADYLEQVADAGDVIVLHDSISGVTFDYYYNGDAPWTAVPALSQANVEAAINQLDGLGQGAQRVWFVTEPTPRTGFPRDLLKAWASDHWPKLFDQRFASLWLALNLEVFVPEPETADLPAGTDPLNLNWSDALTLVGMVSPTEIKAGSYWQPSFYWSQQQAHPEGYDMSLRLTDDSGQIWFQLDQPLWGRYPPASWTEDEIVDYRPVISIPAGLPPGNYQLRLRLSQTADGQSLLVTGEQVEVVVVPALKVTVAQAPDGLDWLPPHRTVGTAFDGQVELLGYHIQVWGREQVAAFRPGHVVPIDFFWQVLEPPTTDYQLRLQLLDSDGGLVAESLSSPTRSDYPSSHWQIGDLLRGQAALTIPAATNTGTYTVRAGLVDPATSEYLTTGWLFGRSLIDLTTIEVRAWDLNTDLPPIETPFVADFGQPPLVTLHGYDLSSETAESGQSLTLNLVWQSQTDAIPANYTVFVHLVGPDGQIAAQGDGVPDNGFRPTTGWRTDEVISDEHTIPIPEGAAPGTYQLWVGFYNPADNSRLDPLLAGDVQPDGRLLLTEITITP